MHAGTDRLEFAPPPQPGLVRAFALAVVAHVLLMLALTWGIQWNRETENVVAEAELWSSVPQQAAPRPSEPPVVQAPPVQPPAPPEPAKEAEVAPPPAPVAREPDIALEREKKRKELAQQHAEELERQKKLEARKKLEEQKREQVAAKKAAEERKKQEELAKSAKEKTRQLADAKRAETLRKENLARMQALAGTGGPTSPGTAQRSSGPSDSYAGRIRARVRPNIVFTDDLSGNPTAEVEVRMAPDGTITSSKLMKSSGVKSWDQAVLRALDKTEVLPRDVDGRVPPHLIIAFRPKD